MSTNVQAFEGFLIRRFAFRPQDVPHPSEWSNVGTTIGALTLRLGLLSVDQLDQLLDAQEREGGRFGEVGVRLGLLSEQQVEALLQIQELHRRLELGERLVVAGLLDLTALTSGLVEFMRAVNSNQAQVSCSQ